MRADAATACQADVDRLDREHDDLQAVASKLDAIHSDEATATGVAAVKTSIEQLGADDSHALHVTAPATAASSGTPEDPTYVELAAASSKQVDDAGTAVHGAIWVLIGALAGAVFSIPFTRLVTPWLR